MKQHYGSNLVLNEVVCLIGASGAGESTLLRCINQLVPFDHGQIYIDGNTLDDENEFRRNGLRKRISIVFQAHNLFPYMNVLSNITLAPGKVQGLSREANEERGMELLRVFGMDSFSRSYPDQLSGGGSNSESP